MKTGFYYGWVMVILALLTLTTYALVPYTYGIFLIPLTQAFGWERGPLSLDWSLAALVSGGLAILTGRLSDRYGPRLSVTAAGLLIGTGFLLMSKVSALWQVYLIFALLMGVGGSGCAIPLSSTIPRWFTKRRGIAVGLTVTGMGLGATISPTLAQWLISSYGWQRAYVILGLIAFTIMTTAAQFMKHSPRQMGLKPYGEEETTEKQPQPPASEGLSFTAASKTDRFWLVGFMEFGFQFSLQSVMIHLAPHAVDIGVPAMIAATFLSILGIGSIIGRVSMGFAADRVGVRPTVAGCLAVFTLALIWLILAREIWAFYVFAIIFGIAYGALIPAWTLAPAELFGLKSLGIITATLLFLGHIGNAIGGPLSGRIFDVTRNYDIAFLIFVILSALIFIAGLILLRAKSYREIRAAAK